MTMRERLLAILRGEPHDRVPFIQYDGLLPTREVWELLGRERVGLLRWSNCWRVEHPHCKYEETAFEQDGRRVIRAVLATPRGTLEARSVEEPTYHTRANHEHFVKEIADYDALDAYLEDAMITYDPTDFERNAAELGDDGLPMVSPNRTAWQQLWIQWVGADDLCWHFAEHEDRLMRTVGLMERIQRQLFDCICRLKPPFVDFPDNITAPMIVRTNFERFCMPTYRELSARAAEFGAPVFCHMDGDLKPLWDLIGESGLRGLDSFSPQPDNDTSVADAVEVWPRMRLFMNFPSSVHLKSPDEIRAHTREILAQGGNTGRLEIQLSENVPPSVWRTSLPVIAEEIEAFGTPGCFR